jgi:hypothetical protein
MTEEETADLDEENGTLELVIYCHECKNIYQINPKFIAWALVSQANIWEVYEAILKYKCQKCRK